ncbi:MAG: HD domain-containing protein [Microthrixaceae bacterium]
MSGRRLRPAHRARRFARSLLPAGTTAEDEAWAAARLSPAEAKAFAAMTANDRLHSLGVARGVVAHLDRLGMADGDEEARWIVTAALTHDVGKAVAGLGTYGRVVATLSGWVGGHDMAEHWAETRGFTRRVGLYLQYERLGADLLAVGGSDPRVVAWAAEHHLPEEDWTVPREAGRLLADADDGRL